MERSKRRNFIALTFFTKSYSGINLNPHIRMPQKFNIFFFENNNEIQILLLWPSGLFFVTRQRT